MMERNVVENADRAEANKTLTMVVYALQAMSFFVGITAIVAVIINYVKRDDVTGTFLESHFRWQIRTFWYGLLWGVLGHATAVFLIGIPILFAAWVWGIYRVVKGWLRFIDNQPMYIKRGQPKI